MAEAKRPGLRQWYDVKEQTPFKFRDVLAKLLEPPSRGGKSQDDYRKDLEKTNKTISDLEKGSGDFSGMNKETRDDIIVLYKVKKNTQTNSMQRASKAVVKLEADTRNMHLVRMLQTANQKVIDLMTELSAGDKSWKENGAPKLRKDKKAYDAAKAENDAKAAKGKSK